MQEHAWLDSTYIGIDGSTVVLWCKAGDLHARVQHNFGHGGVDGRDAGQGAVGGRGCLGNRCRSRTLKEVKGGGAEVKAKQNAELEAIS